MSLRVIVADDHPIVRACVVAEIHKSCGMRLVAEASTPGEIVTALKQTPCDLVITDFSMPGSGRDDGMILLERIQAGWPDVRIMVITMQSNLGILDAIRSKRVSALLSKADGVAEIAAALRAIQGGGTYLSTSVASLLNTLVCNDPEGALHTLTKKEIEVLRMFVSGYSISEIALRRERSVKTVSRQKINAMHKIGLRNDPELYSYAHEHGLG